MNNKLKHAISLFLIICSPIVSADCKLESEIPSSTPDSRFSDHANGTVTDNTTNLMWAKCAHGLSGADCLAGSVTNTNWQGALQAAESSTLADYTDWRLPNVKELRSIVEKRCFNPSINATIFPNTPASNFWSASPTAYGSDGAWHVYFGGGGSYSVNRDGSSHVRLVRSGQ